MLESWWWFRSSILLVVVICSKVQVGSCLEYIQSNVLFISTPWDKWYNQNTWWYLKISQQIKLKLVLPELYILLFCLPKCKEPYWCICCWYRMLFCHLCTTCFDCISILYINWFVLHVCVFCHDIFPLNSNKLIYCGWFHGESKVKYQFKSDVWNE